MASTQELELPASDMLQEDEVTYALEEVELDEPPAAGNAEEGHEAEELPAGQEYHDPSSTTQHTGESIVIFN